MNKLPYIRILFCLSLVTVWFVWLTNLPRVGTSNLSFKDNLSFHKKSKLSLPKVNSIQTESQKLQTSSKPLIEKITTTVKSNEPRTALPETKKLPILYQNHMSLKTKNDLPKLVNLQQLKQPIELKELTTSKSTLDIVTANTFTKHVSEIAQATRNLLITKVLNEKTTDESLDSIKLRKQASTKHENKKLIATSIVKNISDQLNADNTQTTNINEKWLPKYLTVPKDTELKLKNLESDLNKIVNQLEIVGIIESSEGSSAAIIKNKSTSKIEILKKGEEYQQLKLLEVKKDEVILGSLVTNKTFVKKLNTD